MPVVSAYSDGLPFVAFHARDGDGRVLASQNEDERVYAASTIKLAVLVAAMREVDAGTVSLRQSLTVRDHFPSRVAESGDFTFDADERDPGLSAGKQVLLAECLERMIQISSNTATNLIIELVGMSSVEGALRLCGASSSRVERMISDHAARDAGFTHEVTARDLTLIMNAIVAGAVCSPDSTAYMLDLLQGQAFPVIGKMVASHRMWGSKSGWVDGIHHDVAFVGQPGEPGSYILAVCTRGFEDAQAKEAISAVARSIDQAVTASQGALLPG